MAFGNQAMYMSWRERSFPSSQDSSSICLVILLANALIGADNNIFAALQNDDNSISEDEVDATRPTPGRRTCSKCCRVLHKYDYSKKQWSKKNDAKCRVCVGDEQDQPGKTNHLVERQKQRNITDNELAEAMSLGENTEFKDGTVRYYYKGVVYIATSDGVGITAYRLDPLQCICNVKDQSKLRNDYSDEYIGRRKCNRVQYAVQSLVLDLMNYREGCDNLNPSKNPDPFCIGGRWCKVHQTPTDHLAIILEKRKWGSEQMQDVMSHPYVTGLLIIAASGSLLRPVMCNKCHGVKSLQRSPSPYDESDTLPWLRHLLGVMERNKERKEKMDGMDRYSRSVPDVIMDMNVAVCTSALGAAVMAGHYRCTVELLKWGASIENGPMAGGHLPCYLMCKSVTPSNRDFRQTTMCSRHEEILALLAYADGAEGFCKGIEEEEEDRVMKWLKDYGVWEEVEQLYEREGFSVLGSMWDGLCHRFILKGSDSYKEVYKGLSHKNIIASTFGMRDCISGRFNFNDNPMYCDPLTDPVVLAFVRCHQSKAQKRHHGESCCCFSHHVTEVLKEKCNTEADEVLEALDRNMKQMSLTSSTIKTGMQF